MREIELRFAPGLPPGWLGGGYRVRAVDGDVEHRLLIEGAERDLEALRLRDSVTSSPTPPRTCRTCIVIVTD